MTIELLFLSMVTSAIIGLPMMRVVAPAGSLAILAWSSVTAIRSVSARAGDGPKARTNAAASQRRDGIRTLSGPEIGGSFRSTKMKETSTYAASDRRENRRALVRRADRAAEDGEQFAPDADMGGGKVGFGMRPPRPDVVGDLDLEPARRRIETDHVAVPDLADRPARRRLWRHMNRRRHLARGARQ